MPYNIRKIDDEFCVFNSETGDKKGCSSSKSGAVEHMRALYSAEGKTDKEIDGLLDMAIKEYDSAYYNVYSVFATSYRQLEEIEEAQEVRARVDVAISRFPMLASNIMDSPEIEDKKSAIVLLAQELGEILSSDDETKEQKPRTSIVQKVTGALGGLVEKMKGEDSDTGIVVWKETESDRWRWFARYSNSFIDRENEIISRDSHIRFVELVDKGLAPYPELWLWHVKDWKIGQADWVAYDETGENSGFAVSSGYFLDGCEEIAKKLSQTKNLAVSHGMPYKTIERDENDERIITRHETREISPLPFSRAANQLTSFVLSKEADDMAIPKEKRDALKRLGISDDMLASIEAMNANDAKKAIEEGLETKENNEPEVKPEDKGGEPENTPVAESSETKEDTSAPVQDGGETSHVLENYPTKAEVADAMATLLQSVQELSKKFESVEETLKEIKTKQVGLEYSPTASLLDMIQNRTVNNQRMEVSPDDDLSKSKPKETEAEEITGIQFIDSFLSRR